MLPCDLSVLLAFTEPQFLHLCTRDSGGHLPTYQHPPRPPPRHGDDAGETRQSVAAAETLQWRKRSVSISCRFSFHPC